jgi:filamentous hemagglutinin family protein
MALIAVLMTLPRYTQAAPAGSSVVEGSASVSQAGSITSINQSSNRAIINWGGFSIAPGETVNFNQPASTAATLNRVTGNEASIISGALNANGLVYIVNSAGVLFNKGAQVNVGGLVASTLDISNQDFMAGNSTFSGTSAASIVNHGRLHASDGGYIALLGQTVSNDGLITATLGTVAMASGNQITLNFGGNSLVDVTIGVGTLNALVENKRAIKADGGRVIMTAKAADAVLSAQVNNTGIIEARTMSALRGAGISGAGLTGEASTGARTGSIKLLADGGTVQVGGKLDASARKRGNGGTIETSGNKIVIADSAVVTTKARNGATGTWTIDPDGFTIGTGGDMTGAQLSGLLASNNVTILSTNSSGNNGANDGNINVNDAVSWSANTLTLNATNNIFVNNIMTATGSAGLVADYGHGTNADGTPMGLYTYQGATNDAFAGQVNMSGTGGVTMNGQAYTVINNVAGLIAAASHPGGDYVLGSNIASVTAAQWTTPLDDGAAFTGTFNGLGHVITTFTTTGVSLFGTIGTGAVVSNIGIDGPSIAAAPANPKTSAGVLADVNQGSIINSFVSGEDQSFSGGRLAVASSVQSAGSLVGTNSGLIAQSFTANMSLSGVANVAGGFVGTNLATGRITQSSVREDTTTFTFGGGFISGTASTITYTGGFVGVNNGHIDQSYTQIGLSLSGAAIGSSSSAVSGGFAGLNNGTIDQSYSMADPEQEVTLFGLTTAGFVGVNNGTITNAYSTVLADIFDFDGANWTAGFAYKNAGTISNAYTIASAFGTGPQYGFVFQNTGTITNAYWNADPSTLDGSGSTATPLSATQAAITASYVGFDPAIWGASVSGYPVLRNLPVYVSTTPGAIPVYGSAAGDIRTLSLTVQGLQGGGGNISQNFTPLGDSLLDPGFNPFTVVTDNGFVDAGTQAAANVLTSATYANIKGTITVTPKQLTVTGAIEDKVYDGTTSATVAPAGSGLLIGLAGNQLLNVTYTSAAFASKNAGTDQTVNITAVLSNGANGGKASNYTIANTTTATIDPKAVTGTATGNDKVYDGTTGETVSGQVSGAVASDAVSLSVASAQFTDPNAGQGKAVSASGLTLTGTDASNYVLQNSSLQTTATITPRPLILSGAKPADGTTAVPIADLTVTNLVAGDAVQLGGSPVLASSATGVQPIVNLTALTNNNPNYTVIGAVGSVLVGSGLAVDHVASGTATIGTSGTVTTVTQSTPTAIIDWLNFSLASNETLDFVQPASTSVVLNRVTGSASSVIAGALNANGRVFIVNSAGVLFVAGSSVNAGALVASTLNIGDSDFNAGNYLFTAAGGTGSVVAKGDIVVVDGGFVALASGNGVSHTGTLTAPGGNALLVAANSLTLTLAPTGPGLTSYAVGTLAGTTTAAGNINVAAQVGNGGLLETAGVIIDASALTLNTGTNGTWSWTQSSPIAIGAGGTFGGQFVADNLAARNFALTARGGDVTVNDAVTWSASTMLTLNAASDINFNAPVAGTGSASGLTMSYGGDYNILTRATFSGATPDGAAEQAPAGTVFASITLSGASASLSINGNAYTLIHAMSDLTGISGTGHYALAQDLNAAGTTFPHSVVASLTGTLAGLGHTISNLTITDTSNENVGLIASAPLGSVIRDIGLVNVNLTAASAGNGLVGVGALVGHNFANVSHAYSTGNVLGLSNVGGLIGLNSTTGAQTNTISDSFSDAAITGNGGGLIGRAQAVTVSRSHTTGLVTASGSSGGLIGFAINVNVNDSYATGNVTSKSGANTAETMGGLIGEWEGAGTINNAFATGAVDGTYEVGGLIGFMDANGGTMTIQNSHASGNVTGNQPASFVINPGIGGLVGLVQVQSPFVATITNSFATGNVTFVGSNGFGTAAGGLVGEWSGAGTIDHSSASGNVNGNTAGSGAGGLVGSFGGTSITNSSASGNVTGNLSVGGVAGSNTGTVFNSFASGNVVGTGNNVGGVVGSNVGTVDHSGATGHVTGGTGPGNATGGVVGTNSGTVTNSYFSGVVTGAPGQTGEIAGASFNNSGNPSDLAAGELSNNFFLNPPGGDSLPQTNSLSCCAPGITIGGGGLTAQQFGDIAFFQNGTETQVVANRAAAAAQTPPPSQTVPPDITPSQTGAPVAVPSQTGAPVNVPSQADAAAARTADVIGTSEVDQSAETPPEASMSTAGTEAIAAISSPNIEDNLTIREAPQGPAQTQTNDQPAPRSAATGTRTAQRARHAGVRGGAGLGASIRGIEINGQHFDLRGGASGSGTPGQKPQ